MSEKLTEQSDANLSLEGDVFYPRGYIVAAFDKTDDARSVGETLRRDGFADHDITVVSAADMEQQAKRNLDNTSVISAIGSTVAVRRAQYVLAQEGATFLLVNAPEEEQEKAAIAALSTAPVVYAVKYRLLVIENLLPLIPTARPKPEPARGVGSSR